MTALVLLIGLAAASLGAMNAMMVVFAATTRLMTSTSGPLVALFTQLAAAAMPAAAAFLALTVPLITASTTMLLLLATLAGVVATFLLLAASITATTAAFAALFAVMASTSLITASVTAISAGVSQMESAVSSGMQGIVQAMASGMRQAATQVTAGMNQSRSITTSGMAQITAATLAGVMAMIAAFILGKAQTTSTAQSMASSILAIFAALNLTNAGMNIIQGLINGMESMRSYVASTAMSIANQAAEAINNALQIHSPSRVTGKSGQFTDEGFAGGMIKSAGLVQQAANTAIVQPVESATQQIQEISAPDVPVRSSVLTESISAPQNVPGSGSGKGEGETITFVFSPTYHFEGDAPDRDEIVAANRMSEEEFAKMMKKWLRENKRTSFA